MSDVFVSYAREDRDRVEPLVELFEANGLSVWWDRELVPGSTYEDVIDKAIVKAKCVVVIWSKHSISSEWVQAEASDGLERGILIPVLLDKVRIPLAFRRGQAAVLEGWPAKQDASELKRLLKAISDPTSAQPISVETRSNWKPERSWLRRGNLLIGLAVLVLAAILIEFRPKDQTTTDTLFKGAIPVASITILPFSSRDGVDSVNHQGITYEVSNLLQRVGSLHIAPRQQVESYLDNLTRGFDTGLQAEYKLSGIVSDDGLSVMVSFTDDEDSNLIWSRSYELSDETISSTVHEIANDVATSFNLNVPVVAEDISSSTYLIYLKAQAELRKPVTLEILSEAKSQFEETIRLAPRFAEAHAGLCRSYIKLYRETMQINNFEMAERHCHRANTLNSNDSSVYIALGALYRNSGKLIESVDSIRHALQLTPFSSEAMRQLGQTYLKQGKIEAAEKQLLAAVKIEPGYWVNYQELGRLHFNNGNYAKAAEYYQMEVELAGEKSRALNNLAAAYYLSEQFDRAIDAWRSTAEVISYSPTLSNLGSAYFFKREFDLAADMYKQAIRITPEDHAYWGNAGEALLYAESSDADDYFERAIELAEPLLAIDPKDYLTLSSLATYYAARNNADRADALITQALTLQPGDVYLVYDAARTMARPGRNDETSQLLDQLVEMGYSEALIALDANFDQIEK